MLVCRFSIVARLELLPILTSSSLTSGTELELENWTTFLPQSRLLGGDIVFAFRSFNLKDPAHYLLTVHLCLLPVWHLPALL